jgi:hypothetical protein
MYITKSCCQVPAVVSSYSPVGIMENLGDLPIYAVGDKVKVATGKNCYRKQYSKILHYIEF